MSKSAPVTSYMDREGQDWEVREDDSSVRIVPWVIANPDTSNPTVVLAEEAILVYAAEDTDAAELIAHSKESRRMTVAYRLEHDSLPREF